jgi:probable HAF family extracellular repeat protein
MVARHTPFIATGSLAIVLSVATAATANAAPSYAILDLGTLGGNMSAVTGSLALNASGQVAGYTNLGTPGTLFHGFATAPGLPITPASDVGSLGGPSTLATSVNAAGQVTGNSRLPIGQDSHAFRTAAGQPIKPADDLGSLGGPESIGRAINASGQVAGESVAHPTLNIRHAFRTTATGKVSDPGADLGTLGGTDSDAHGINASGQVVGWAELPGDVSTHAFRTAPNGPIDAASDLGTLGGPISGAYGVNDKGRVVGTSDTVPGPAARPTHAFRTAPNGPIEATGDLGTLGGTVSGAYGINNLDQVVGYSTISPADGGGVHAFFCDASGPMVDLNALIPAGTGWVLTHAHSINDAGQIAGVGTIDGQTHAFLLTPTPEPGAAAALAAALAGATWRRGRRAR